MPYLVSLELGDPYDAPDVLVSETVELIAGERKAITLNFDISAPVGLVEVGGTVTLPGAWHDCDFEVKRVTILFLRLLDPPIRGKSEWSSLLDSGKPRPDAGDFEYPFKIEGLQPGRYEVGLREPPVSWPVTIESSGRIGLVAPPPAQVELRLVDQEGGRVAKSGSLSWWPESAGISSERSADISRDSPSVRLCTAPGKLIVYGSGDGLRVTRKTVTVEPGYNVVDIEGARDFSFTIVIKDEEGRLVTIATEEDRASLNGIALTLDMREVANQSAVLWAIEYEEGIVVTVSGPGTFRFDIPEFEGFHDIPTQEIVVTDNRELTHEVVLERK